MCLDSEVYSCPPHMQEEIYSSSYAAAAYLDSIQFKKKVRSISIGIGIVDDACARLFFQRLVSFPPYPMGTCIIPDLVISRHLNWCDDTSNSDDLCHSSPCNVCAHACSFELLISTLSGESRLCDSMGQALEA